MQLVVEEESTPKDTVERYRKLILQDKVEVVIGGISTGVTLALGPVAEEMEVPWLSWDGTTQKGVEETMPNPKWAFRSVDNEVEAIVAVAVKHNLFILSGEMAVAYFQFHQPQSFWPTVNGGVVYSLGRGGAGEVWRAQDQVLGVLVALKVAAKYQGKYISHMRSEGNQLFEALDELLRIAREANIPAELYHIKAAGKKNWPKVDELLARIERAQKEGLNVRANMYTYPAAGTGLDACLPPWTEDGGYPALFKRLRDPATREKIKAEVQVDSDKWENLYLAAGSPEKILLVGFKSEKLKPLTGKTLAEVAKMRGKDPIDTAMDLIAEDESRISTVYYVMSEENVKKELRKPWISFGSDEASQAPESPFTKSNPHPRAYGNFARVLGKYARDEKVLSMSDAIHRLSGLPATNLGLDHRGFLKEGMFADVVVFDPATITDHATFEKPHQYATGVKHVFVNGVQVIKNGEHTGAKPGRALWGPGKAK